MTYSLSANCGSAQDSRPPPRIRIYIVEPDPLSRTALAELIAGEPDMTLCGEAESAAVGYRAIAGLAPNVAVVDSSSEPEAALVLIRNIRQLEPRTKIVAISAHPEVQYVWETLGAGARGCVARRAVEELIVHVIRFVHGGGVFASGEFMPHILNRFRVGIRPDPGAPRPEPAALEAQMT